MAEIIEEEEEEGGSDCVVSLCYRFVINKQTRNLSPDGLKAAGWSMVLISINENIVWLLFSLQPELQRVLGIP